MIITIPGFLPNTIADQIVSDIKGLNWHAGKHPHKEYTERIKKNQELKERDSPVVARYAKSLLSAILSHEEFRSKAFPHKVKMPLFNKYSGGGTYHRHSDSAFIGAPEIRTDLSVTVFLNDPDEYEGGELTLEYPSGETRKLKEKKGTLVCYPSGVLHYVTPVTQGTRYAAITWVHSFIRSPNQRDVLASLVALSTRLKATEGMSDTYTELISIENNLLRMWSEI